MISASQSRGSQLSRLGLAGGGVSKHVTTCGACTSYFGPHAVNQNSTLNIGKLARVGFIFKRESLGSLSAALRLLPGGFGGALSGAGVACVFARFCRRTL